MKASTPFSLGEKVAGAAGRMRVSVRLSRPLLIALAAMIALVAAAGFGASLAWSRYEAGLGPIDLASSREGSTIVVDRDGRLLRPFTLPDGRWRLPATTHDVDPRYVAMLIAYEDARFYAHDGVDLRALLRAGGQWLVRGHVVSGGSTLTMQLARLIEPRSERTLAAKLRQIARALEIERQVGKEGALDRYLMLAPFGGNLEGVRAASLAYFGKEPLKLSLAEAALLVALPQSPEARRPDRSPGAARAARDRVLARVAARGLVSAEDAAAAMREPVPEARIPFPTLAAHAAEEAVAADREAKVIRLAIDGRLQAKLEALAKESAARLGPKLSAAIVVIDNASGEVRARVGAAAYDDASRDGAVDMSRAPALAGLGAEALHLCARVRTGPRASRDGAVRSADALRRLCAGEFHPGLRGHGDGAQGAADVAQSPGGRTARRSRPGDAAGAAAWRGRGDRAAEGYADRSRHRPWRARHIGERSRAALRRSGARGRDAAADRAARRSAGGRAAPPHRPGRRLLRRRHPARGRRRRPTR